MKKIYNTSHTYTGEERVIREKMMCDLTITSQRYCMKNGYKGYYPMHKVFVGDEFLTVEEMEL
jgi:hypothetical protein